MIDSLNTLGLGKKPEAKVQLAHCHVALWWWDHNSTWSDTTLPRALPGPPFLLDMAFIWLLQVMLTCISNCVLIKVSFLLNTLLGPGGQGLLLLLPCVRLQEDCTTLRPVSPPGKSRIETGPFWTRAVSDSGTVARSPNESEQEVTAQAGALWQRHLPAPLLSW